MKVNSTGEPAKSAVRHTSTMIVTVLLVLVVFWFSRFCVFVLLCFVCFWCFGFVLVLFRFVLW